MSDWVTMAVMVAVVVAEPEAEVAGGGGVGPVVPVVPGGGGEGVPGATGGGGGHAERSPPMHVPQPSQASLTEQDAPSSQGTPTAMYELDGQVGVEPEHDSATSQADVAGRQTWEAGR